MTGPHSSERARAFCFTSFSLDKPSIQQYKYLCYQKEMCPTTGTIHLQGFIYFQNPRTFNSVRKELGGLTHVEIARDIKASIDYCSKSETAIPSTFYEDGTKPECAREKGWWQKVPIASLWEEEPEWMLRHHSAVTAYYKQKKSVTFARPKPIVIVLWGPPGTGKSHTARNVTEEYYVKPSGPWWDGYTGQETVIFDDFYSSEKYCDMLRWLSENPIKVPIKGGMVDLLAVNFIITSNQSPSEWYPAIEDKSALARRITEVIHMTDVYRPEEDGN